jgi:myo-inositol-1(or 4)-monophosphatase
MFSSDLGQQFVDDLRAFCEQLSLGLDLGIQTKSDSTLVTRIDHDLSHFCKNHPSAAGFHFYSEEDHTTLQFPAMVVDPLDGTLELIAGRPECAVSVAWMPTSDLSQGFAVVFNPFTGFSLTSADRAPWKAKANLAEPIGMISRTEWAKGLYKDKAAHLIPRGSIAFKLSLLASGTCDYVVSLRPKNIWDVAAGTMLCQQRGIEMWSGGRRIERLDQARYEAPLLWARPELIPILRGQF